MRDVMILSDYRLLRCCFIGAHSLFQAEAIVPILFRYGYFERQHCCLVYIYCS